MMATYKRILGLLSLLVLLSSSQYVRAQNTYYSVGPKIGYTFGENGGWTFGGEVSIFPPKWNTGYGFQQRVITIDASMGPNRTANLHLGYEDVSLVATGADFGPSLLINDGTPYLGASAILFAGLFVYGYVELQYFPFRPVPALGSIGSYMKFPIGMSVSLRNWSVG